MTSRQDSPSTTYKVTSPSMAMLRRSNVSRERRVSLPLTAVNGLLTLTLRGCVGKILIGNDTLSVVSCPSDTRKSSSPETKQDKKIPGVTATASQNCHMHLLFSVVWEKHTQSGPFLVLEANEEIALTPTPNKVTCSYHERIPHFMGRGILLNGTICTPSTDLADLMFPCDSQSWLYW